MCCDAILKCFVFYLPLLLVRSVFLPIIRSIKSIKTSFLSHLLANIPISSRLALDVYTKYISELGLFKPAQYVYRELWFCTAIRSFRKQGDLQLNLLMHSIESRVSPAALSRAH